MIQFLAMPRQTGRTTRAVEYVLQNDGAVLVVGTNHIRQWTQRNFQLNDKQVCTWDDLKNNRYYPRYGFPTGVILDNLEEFLPRMLDLPMPIIGCVTEQPVDHFVSPEVFREQRTRQIEEYAEGRRRMLTWKTCTIEQVLHPYK